MSYHHWRELPAPRLITKRLSVHERGFLAVCQRIFRREDGCDTPFEDFFTELAFHVQHGEHRGRAVTLEDVRRCFERFEDNWNVMISYARYLQKHHPTIFAEIGEAAQTAKSPRVVMSHAPATTGAIAAAAG